MGQPYHCAGAAGGEGDRKDRRQPAFAADGSAISNDARTLYYQALTGKTLYAVDTVLLRQDVPDAQREASLKTVAQTQVTDGLCMSKAASST